MLQYNSLITINISHT